MQNSNLPKHLIVDLDPMAPATAIRVPHTVSQPFSRSARKARKADEVDTSVKVRRAEPDEMAGRQIDQWNRRDRQGLDWDRLPGGPRVTWTEERLSDCAFGCKVYRSEAGQREVQHNSAYGCPRGGRNVRLVGWNLGARNLGTVD